MFKVISPKLRGEKGVGIEDIVEKFNLRLLIVFCSFGTKQYTERSDIDLGYLAKNPLQTEDEISLLQELVFYFQKDRIDLVNLHQADPLLLYEVANKGRALYEKEDAFLHFKLKAFARYAETRFLRKKRRDFLLKNPINME